MAIRMVVVLPATLVLGLSLVTQHNGMLQQVEKVLHLCGRDVQFRASTQTHKLCPY